MVLLFGIVLVLVMHAMLTPWGFFLGGQFHILPYWQGWGRMHSNTSGDYVLFVRFEPRFGSGSRMYPSSTVRGLGYLCSPRGERFRLNLGGSMRWGLKHDTDGEAIHLYMDNSPLLYGQFITDRRPNIDLRGYWRNPNLVMDDHGSIWNSFQPDGTVYRGHSSNRPYSSEILPITLAPGSYSQFEAACPANR